MLFSYRKSTHVKPKAAVRPLLKFDTFDAVAKSSISFWVLLDVGNNLLQFALKIPACEHR